MIRGLKNRIWGVVKCVLGIERYEVFRAWYNLGYVPDVKTPKTFCEKVMHRKLYQHTDHLITLSDKVEVRAYVEQKLGPVYLNKVYYVGDSPAQIPWESLPLQFVIKTTYAGGGEGNIFVFNKDKADISRIKRKLRMKLKDRFGYWTNEDWYMKMPRRFLIEELLLDEEGEIPMDYKLLCFHGKCRYIQVDQGRFSKHARSFYDTEWNYQDFSVMYSQGPRVKRPKHLEEMIQIAEKLAEDFDFIRVDLYSLNEGIRFGELTFTPSSGWGKFSVAGADKIFGDLWNLKTG